MKKHIIFGQFFGEISEKMKVIRVYNGLKDLYDAGIRDVHRNEIKDNPLVKELGEIMRFEIINFVLYQ